MRGALKQVLGAAVVVAAVPEAKPGAADRVGCGNAGEDRQASGHVEVLIAAAFLEHRPSDVQVRLGGPQPGAGIVAGAW